MASLPWRVAFNVMLVVLLLLLLSGSFALHQFKSGLLDSALLGQQALANEVVAELQGQFDSPRLLNLASLAADAGNRLFLLGSTGAQVFGPAEQPQGSRQSALVRNPAFRRVRQQRIASAIGEDDARQAVLMTYRQVPDSDLTLVLLASRDQALQPFQQLRWQLLGALPLVCLAVLLVVWWMARRLLGRVDRQVRHLLMRNLTLSDQRNQLATQADRDCRFFQEASHDFRQRLHAMQLLLHTMQRCDQREGRQLLAKSLYVVLNLQTYVKDFLELARLKVDQQSPDSLTLEVQRLFQELELGFEDVALERRVDLRFRASALHVASDHKLLLRILENLLANACKFARSRVLVAARRSQGCVALEVWDNGPGIAEKDRQRIFDAYYQASRGTPSDEEGVGLGLAIVMRLCVVLGHEVSVHARHGLTLVRICIRGGTSQEP